MKSIADYNIQIPTPAQQKPNELLQRSDRDVNIQLFLGHGIKLTDRATKKLRDATAAEIALLLKDCPTEDLWAFHKQCLHAETYARFFWWRLKGKQTKV